MGSYIRAIEINMVTLFFNDSPIMSVVVFSFTLCIMYAYYFRHKNIVCRVQLCEYLCSISWDLLEKRSWRLFLRLSHSALSSFRRASCICSRLVRRIS